jgi:hypothetical protein
VRVRLVRRPGQAGTKAYVAEYGERLVCVRYRYDSEARRRYKTVEIIVDEAPWTPKYKPDELVGVRVAYGEVEVGQRLRQAGGIWRRELRVWQLPHARVVELGLTVRIVGTIKELLAERRGRSI